MFIFQCHIIHIILESTCALHLGKHDPKEKIIHFKEETLRIYHEKKEKRDKLKKKKSKYDDIVLPTQADGEVGYHAKCYRY